MPSPPPVVAVGHAVDLALLTVSDEGFWTEPTPMLPLALGDIPQLQESVLVIGYPTGALVRLTCPCVMGAVVGCR
jgi:hypothetical protein